MPDDPTLFDDDPNTDDQGWFEITPGVVSRTVEAAHARRTDPQTSHDAARSISSDKIRASQQAVLDVLAQRGPMSDADLVDLYVSGWTRHTDPPEFVGPLPMQSPSGIRTRRAELVELGKVVDSGERATLPSGRRAIVWKAAAI